MKKNIFLKLTTALLAVAFLASCSDDDKKGGNGGGTDPIDPPVVVTSAITVDGSFSDWSALAAADVLQYEYDANTDSGFPAVKELKLYAEDQFLNIYMKMDYNAVKDDEWSALHLYFDTDGANTGYTSGAYAEGVGVNYAIEAGFMKYGEVLRYEDDAHAFSFANGEGWETTTIDGDGYITGFGKVTGDVVEYELQIIRELLTFPLGSTVRMFVDVQYLWNSVGYLPQNAEGLATPAIWNVGE